MNYPLLDYPTLALEHKTVDLSPYAGKTIGLRLRYKVGGIGFVDVQRIGWYVDNIAVDHSDWSELATVNGTSYKVAGLGAGPHCFRIRATYRVRGALVEGLPSSPLATRVASGVIAKTAKPKPATVKGTKTLPATGVAGAPLAGLLLLTAGAVGTGIIRRTRSR